MAADDDHDHQMMTINFALWAIGENMTTEDVKSDTGLNAGPVTFVRGSDSGKPFIEALCKLQSQLEGAKRDSNNPHFKSTYADLESCWTAIRKPMAENGFALFQATASAGPNQVSVVTRLMHVSGAWMSFETTLPVSKADAQGYGSAITYARRYGLMAAVGLTPTDDDGNAASGRPASPAQDPRLPGLAEAAKLAFKTGNESAMADVIKKIEGLAIPEAAHLLEFCTKKLSEMKSVTEKAKEAK